jgi:hypothetical protein
MERRDVRPTSRRADPAVDASPDPGAYPLLHLQRTAGNMAVARLMETGGPAGSAAPLASELEALRGPLETEHRAALTAYHDTGAQITALQAQPRTPEQDAQLALLQTRQAQLVTHLLRTENDLRLIADPAAPVAQQHELLARRRSAATLPAVTEGGTSSRLVDGMAISSTESSDWAATLTSFSWMSGSSSSAVSGTESASGARDTTRTVELAGGNLGYTNVSTTTSNQSNTDPANPYSASSSRVDTTRVGTGGYSSSTSVTEVVDGQGFGRTTSSGVTRGDGKLGYTTSSGRSSGTYSDGSLVSGTSTSSTAGGGVIAGPDGYGGYGTAGGDASRQLSKNVKVGVSGGLDGRFTVNVVQSGYAPPQFTIVTTISLGARLGTSGSAARGPASGSVTGSASGTVTATFKHVLAEADAKAYLAGLENPVGAPKGRHRELAILAAAVTDGDSAAIAMLNGAGAVVLGDLSAAAELPEGDSASLLAEGGLEGGVSVGGRSGGGASFGANVGGGVTGSVQWSVTKKAGKVILTATPASGQRWSVGATAGYGVASMGLSHEEGDEVVTSFTFTFDPARSGHAALYQRVTGTGDPAVLASIAAQHPELRPARTVSTTHKETDGTTMSAAGVTLGITQGSSRTSERATDAGGKTTVTETGTGTGGMTLSAGDVPYSYSETATMTTTVDDNKATGDVSVGTSETDLGTTAQQFVDNPIASAVGLFTGGTKVAQKTDTLGLELADEDYARIAATAGAGGSAWDKVLTSPRDIEDWHACRARIRAAGEDRAQIAAALADFVAGDSSRRGTMVQHIVRPLGTAEGGQRYEWPGSLSAEKGVYDALVVGDPLAAITALARGGDQTGAVGKAATTLTALAELSRSLQANHDKFSDGAAYASMLRRIAEREAAITREARRIERGLPASTDVNSSSQEEQDAAEDVRRAEANATFDRLRQALDGLLATQGRLFGQVQGEQAKKDNWFDKPDVVVIAHKLNELRDAVYPEWDRTLTEARTAGAAAGVPTDGLPVPARPFWQTLYNITFSGW